MARILKPQEYTSKRNEILDAARRLLFTKGYERMSVQDILVAAGISSGAFHHYFASREALLEAIIQSMEQAAEAPLLPVIRAPQLTAIQKLQGFFEALDQLRFALRADVYQAARVWYTDANAVVRIRVDEAFFRARAPLIAEIVRQGVREGAFNTPDPAKAGEVVMALLQGMGNTHAGLLLNYDPAAAPGADQLVAEVIATHAAYMDAIERVLGAPANSLTRTTPAAVKAWLSAIKELS
jgi:AcrR family transcriptional regulator